MSMMQVDLPPALERFARDCVAQGDYVDVSDVVRSGLRLLQAQEQRREAFDAMMAATEAEAAGEGVWDADVVLNEIEAVIQAARR